MVEDDVSRRLLMEQVFKLLSDVQIAVLSLFLAGFTQRETGSILGFSGANAGYIQRGIRHRLAKGDLDGSFLPSLWS